jgi:hypothetical protein
VRYPLTFAIKVFLLLSVAFRKQCVQAALLGGSQSDINMHSLGVFTHVD